MIDRNIRQTRSKEEAKKAHWRAAGTLLCMMVLYGIITKIQSLILNALKDVSQLLAVLVSVAAGFALTSAAVWFIYRLVKAWRKTE